MKFILPLLLFTQACGAQSTPSPIYKEEALKPYEKSFNDDAKMYGVSIPKVKLSYRFDNAPLHPSMPNAVGLCSINSLGDRLITVDATYWENSAPIEKKALFYHELGHCVMSLGHVEELKDSTLVYELANRNILYAVF